MAVGRERRSLAGLPAPPWDCPKAKDAHVSTQDLLHVARTDARPATHSEGHLPVALALGFHSKVPAATSSFRISQRTPDTAWPSSSV